MNKLKLWFRYKKLQHNLNKIAKARYCKMFSLGYYTIVVWDNGGFLGPAYYDPTMYYHPEKYFDKFTITSHGYDTGEWLFSCNYRDTKEYDRFFIRRPEPEHLDKLLELSQLIYKRKGRAA